MPKGPPETPTGGDVSLCCWFHAFFMQDHQWSPYLHASFYGFLSFKVFRTKLAIVEALSCMKSSQTATWNSQQLIPQSSWRLHILAVSAKKTFAKSSLNFKPLGHSAFRHSTLWTFMPPYIMRMVTLMLIQAWWIGICREIPIVSMRQFWRRRCCPWRSWPSHALRPDSWWQMTSCWNAVHSKKANGSIILLIC